MVNFCKLATLILTGGGMALAQATPAPLTPKQSPASDTLTNTAKQVAVDRIELQTKFNQARSTMDASAKTLQADYDAATKALREKLKQDKKYADDVKHIETVQDQMNKLSSDTQAKFQKEAGALNQKISTEDALITGLQPVVRKENDFPDSAIFDPATQTWRDNKPAEPKK